MHRNALPMDRFVSNHLSNEPYSKKNQIFLMWRFDIKNVGQGKKNNIFVIRKISPKILRKKKKKKLKNVRNKILVTIPIFDPLRLPHFLAKYRNFHQKGTLPVLRLSAGYI